MVRYYYDGGGQAQTVSYGHSIPLNSTVWFYLPSGTCDTSGAAGDMKIYLNGSLVNTASYTEIKTSGVIRLHLILAALTI